MAKIINRTEIKPQKNYEKYKYLILLVIPILFLSFYTLPDKVYLDDGLIFGAMIDGHVPSLKPVMLYPRHLISNYIGKFFYLSINSMSTHFKSGYDALRFLNNIYGLLGAILLYMFLYYKSKNVFQSIIFTSILVYSYGYWSRATEGQVYMSSIFWVLLTFCFVQSFIEKYSLNKVLVGSIFLTLLAIYHHITNVLLVIPIAVSFLLIEDRKKGIRYSLLYIGAIIMGMVIPYAFIFKLFSLNSFIAFFKGEGETHLAYTDVGSKFTISYILLVFKNLIIPTIFVTRNKLMSMLSLGVVFVLAYGWWRFLKLKGYLVYKQFLSYLALTITYVCFFYFWYPDTPWFWVIPFFPIVLIAFYGWMLDDTSITKTKIKWALTTLSVVFLTSNNLFFGIYYNSKETNNKGLQMAKFISENIPNYSQVIVAGQGSRFNGDRFYLTYIYNLSRISFYDGLLGYPKQQFFKMLKDGILKEINRNIYVYTTNTVMEGQVFKHLNKLFQVTQKDFEIYFDNYIYIPIASENKLNFVIYQIFPKVGDKSFSMLLRKYAQSYIKDGFYINAYTLYISIPYQYKTTEDVKIIKDLSSNYMFD